MNIQEALKQSLKTGKQFYRKSEGNQLTFEVSKSNRCIDIYIEMEKKFLVGGIQEIKI